MNREPGRITREIAQVAQVLRTADNLRVLTHVNPDGDTLGSGLALAAAMRTMGKEARVYASLPLPEDVADMAPVDAIVPLEDFRPDGAVVAFVDCGTRERAGVAPFANDQAVCVLNLDHHQANDEFGDVNVVDADASSTAELVWQVLRSMSMDIDTEVARYLYIGIATDCGFFRHGNTTPFVLRLAAILLERGVDPEEVQRQVIHSRSYNQLQLIGRVLNQLQLRQQGRIVAGVISQALFTETGTSSRDTEGVMEVMRSLRTAEIAVLFRELDNEVRVSFRSSACDVRQIAQHFGGGGHIRAAGCNVPGALDAVVGTVLAKTEEALLRDAPADSSAVCNNS